MKIKNVLVMEQYVCQTTFITIIYRIDHFGNVLSPTFITVVKVPERNLLISKLVQSTLANFAAVVVVTWPCLYYAFLKKFVLALLSLLLSV